MNKIMSKMKKIRQFVAECIYPEHSTQNETLCEKERLIEDLQRINDELRSRVDELNTQASAPRILQDDTLLEKATWKTLVDRLCMQVQSELTAKDKVIGDLRRQVNESHKYNSEVEKKIACSTEFQPSEKSNLLDNTPWRTLVERLCDQVKRIRRRVSDIRTNEEVAGRSPIPFLESLDSALREAMIASGAEPIDNDKVYDILSHEVVPPVASVPEQTAIADTLEVGVKTGNHVFIRALVELAK